MVDLYVDSLVVGTFTGIFVILAFYFITRWNLSRNDLDWKSYNWEPYYSAYLHEFNWEKIDHNKLINRLKEIGFIFVKQVGNKIILKRELSFWSGRGEVGEVIEINIANKSVHSYSTFPLASMDWVWNKINVEKISKLITTEFLYPKTMA